MSGCIKIVQEGHKAGIKKDTKVNCIKLNSYFDLIGAFKDIIVSNYESSLIAKNCKNQYISVNIMLLPVENR